MKPRRVKPLGSTHIEWSEHSAIIVSVSTRCNHEPKNDDFRKDEEGKQAVKRMVIGPYGLSSGETLGDVCPRAGFGMHADHFVSIVMLDEAPYNFA
jgi:hypothetical protein